MQYHARWMRGVRPSPYAAPCTIAMLATNVQLVELRNPTTKSMWSTVGRPVVTKVWCSMRATGMEMGSYAVLATGMGSSRVCVRVCPCIGILFVSESGGCAGWRVLQQYD